MYAVLLAHQAAELEMASSNEKARENNALSPAKDSKAQVSCKGEILLQQL
jgi:hypothetical protein